IVRGRSEELEALAVEMYARGLSTRDIEALFADERGQSLLSRTAVSEITQRLRMQYEGFARSVRVRRDLPVCRRPRRAAASRATARGGAGRLGCACGRS